MPGLRFFRCQRLPIRQISNERRLFCGFAGWLSPLGSLRRGLIPKGAAKIRRYSFTYLKVQAF